MSTRFFASIRRNQRQWMVVVTVLSMVSFLFLDNIGQGSGPMSPFSGAIMIGVLCAAGMCIIGYPRGKTAEYGVGGLIIGAVFGFIGFSSAGQNKPVVRTASGSFNRSDLDRLSLQRQKANQFVVAVARKLKSNGQPQGFVGTDDQSMIGFKMWSEDAKTMGIRVSDDSVNDFLERLTQKKLSTKAFKECLRETQLGEGELYEILKKELAAQLAAELMYPPAFVATAPQGFAQYVREPLRYMQQTPDQLWESFQKLNLKQSLDAVAIPVKEFVGQVGTPSEAELVAFFDKFRNNRWTDEARPGFVLMPQVRLAYLEADFEKFESGINPTDEDIRDYYEQNKDRYRAPEAKESTAPNLSDEEIEASKTGGTAADALKPDVSANSKDSEAGGAQKNVEPAPAAAEKKDAASEQKTPDTKDPKPADDAKKEPAAVKSDPDKSSCGEEGSDTGKTAAETPPAEKAAEPKPAVVEATEKPDGTANPKSETTPEGSSIPKLSDSPESLPAPKLRELNDSLKDEIRDVILRDRAFVKMGLALDRAYDTMTTLGLDYDTVESVDQKKEVVAEQKKEKATAIAAKLKQYAIEHNLEYKETSLAVYEDLNLEPIGGAFEGQGRSPVVNEVFMQSERGEPRMPLYSPRRADLRSKQSGYSYWKIEETAARVADLKDEAIREKVIAAWKFDQARSLAEKRAKVLADKAKAEGNTFSASFAEESATGEKNAPQLSIIETPEFSWLSTPKSVPSAQQDPMITDIPLITDTGNEFMKVVFEELNEGEIGVAVNETRSIYYVVKVKDREGSKDDGGVSRLERQKKFMSERFTGFFPIMKSPYEALAQFPQGQIDQAWRQNFEKRHSVDWVETPGQARPVRSSGQPRRRRR